MLKLNRKKRQLVLAFFGRAPTPKYPNGRLAAHVADLRKKGIVHEQKLTWYGNDVAIAILNGQPLPERDSA